MRDSAEGKLHEDAALNPLSASSNSPPSFHETSPEQTVFPDTYMSDIKAPAYTVETLETAVDFVLALEAPCMRHIPYPADLSGDDPDNHIMMMST